MQAKDYLKKFYTVLDKLELTGQQGEIVDFEEGIQKLIALFLDLILLDRKIIFIGNGGSAAIASHMAVDFSKNGAIPALCFNDGAQLSCFANDYGYPEVFSQPVNIFARPGDILVAISSSGQSANILNAVTAAVAKGCQVITLSGFSPVNPLRSRGNLNIYCAAQEYGLVELSHQLLLHMLLDLMINREAG